MTAERLVEALRQEARRVASMPARLRRGVPRRFPGDRYSRRVALLKRVLPAIGVSLLLLVAAWPRLAPLIEIRIPGIDLREARELKMVDPRYAGVDRSNRPYVVTAATGRQVPDRSDLMSLELPKANMVMHNSASVTITAATGVYQSQAQLLDLTRDVVLTRQDGTRFVTNSAHVNLANDTAEGHEPVTGHGPAGDISGQGFRILSRGDTVIFTGNSKARLNAGRPNPVATAPPTLPAAVDAAAAQLAAAAAAAPAGKEAPAVAGSAAVPEPRPVVVKKREHAPHVAKQKRPTKHRAATTRQRRHTKEKKHVRHRKIVRHHHRPKHRSTVRKRKISREHKEKRRAH